jgi:hypothetical protein
MIDRLQDNTSFNIEDLHKWALSNDCAGAKSIENKNCKSKSFGYIEQKSKLFYEMDFAGNNIDKFGSYNSRVDGVPIRGDATASDYILYIGDSQASDKIESIDYLGKKLNKKIISQFNEQCNFILPSYKLQSTIWSDSDCVKFNSKVIKKYAKQAKYIIISNAIYDKKITKRLESIRKSIIDLKQINSHIIFIQPAGTKDITNCLKLKSAKLCKIAKKKFYGKYDYSYFKSFAGVRVLKTEDLYCKESKCYSAIGGIGVYFQGNHISKSYDLTLKDIIYRKFLKLISK